MLKYEDHKQIHHYQSKTQNGKIEKIKVRSQSRIKFLLLAAIATVVFGIDELRAQQLEEIIVTAQKREQNIQDVPITINALSGDEIRKLGFHDAADIQYQTPGLVVSYSSTNAIPNFVLRGVGLNDFTAIQNSPIAIHSDEVYYGNSTLLNFGLFDIERVEVLKGPQGTLFGRNSTGGAVNFFSAKPSNEFSASIDLGVANYSNITAEGYVNGGLSDNLSGRLSMQVINQSGGAFRHPTHGEIGEQKKYALRGQLLWDTEKLTAHLTVFGGQNESEGNQYQGIPTYQNDGSFDFCDPISAGNPECSFDAATSTIDDDNPFTLQSGVINRDEIDALGSVFRINYEITEKLSLTSVTGYNQVDRESQEDADGSLVRNVDVGYKTSFEQFSEELRLASVGQSRWDWTLGLYYSSDELDAPLTETDGSALEYRQNHAYTLETKSFAIFLHNEFHLTDSVTIFGGLRYTNEDRAFKGGTIDSSERINEDGDPLGEGDTPLGAGDLLANTPGPSDRGDFVPAVPGPARSGDTAYLDREITFSEISWTIGVSLDVSEQAMIYAKIANGFKSGGFIGDITVQSILSEPYDKETLTSYEIGLKSDWFDKRLRLNAGFFYYDYQNAIVALTIPADSIPDSTIDLLINENGADADVYGLEADFWLLPVEGLDIKFGITWLDTDTTGIATSPFPVTERLDGNKLVYAPEFSANGLIRYEKPFSGGRLLGFGQFDFTTRAKHWAEATNVPVSSIDGYTLLNARLGIGSASDKWQVYVWGKNLTDKRYTQYINDLRGLGSILKTPGYPRTYGLGVSFTFGS